MSAGHDRAEDEEEELEVERPLEEVMPQVDRGVAEEEPLAEARYLDMIRVIEQMLDGDSVRLDELTDLSDEERDSLALLQHIVSGRDASNTFMYAEERLDALNGVLAELQPALSVGGVHEVLRTSLTRVIDGFAELRDQLKGLEDAEEEVFHEAEAKAAAGESDEDDKPDDELEDEKRTRDKKKAPAKGDAAAASEKPAKPAAAAVDVGEAGGDQPRPSRVWDPEDRGGGGT